MLFNDFQLMHLTNNLTTTELAEIRDYYLTLEAYLGDESPSMFFFKEHSRLGGKNLVQTINEGNFKAARDFLEELLVHLH